MRRLFSGRRQRPDSSSASASAAQPRPPEPEQNPPAQQSAAQPTPQPSPQQEQAETAAPAVQQPGTAPSATATPASSAAERELGPSTTTLPPTAAAAVAATATAAAEASSSALRPPSPSAANAEPGAWPAPPGPGYRLSPSPSGRTLWRLRTPETPLLSPQPSPPPPPLADLASRTPQPPPQQRPQAAMSADVAAAGGGDTAPPFSAFDKPKPGSPAGRAGGGGKAEHAPPTPFLAAPLQQQPATRPYPGAGAATGASRASSVAGTAAGTAAGAGMAGTPYGGKVDLDLDVAVVGAGVTGLATALALKRVHPRMRVKVFDRRPAPAGPDRKYGAYCRLEPNGLRAAAAIDPRLRRAILRQGLKARPVLIHDTDGSLITRLEEASTASMRRFGEPYITIGWYELEQALLSLLPPGTVQYGAQYTGHRERDDAAYIAFRPTRGAPPAAPSAAAGFAAAAPVSPAAASAASTAAPPALVRAAFLVACDGPFSEVRKRVVRDGDPMYDGVVKWLGRLPGDDVPSLPLDFNAVWLSPGRTFLSHSLAGGDVAWEAVVTDPDLRASGFRYNTASKRVERVAPPRGSPSLRSGSVREPSLGFGSRRLPSHPSPGTRRSAFPGGGIEDAARRLFEGGLGLGGGGGRGTAAAAPPAGPGELAPAAPAAAAADGYGDSHGATASDAVPAADVSYLDSEELRSEGEEEEEEGGAVSEEEEADEDGRGRGEVLEKLLALFGNFPPEVRAMLRNSRPSVVVEAGVWVRRAKDLPSALGRGRVLIVGEAAHPMRPSSQEENQALEDAAVLGWAVARHGLNKEALRRYEAERKPRWRHVMQLAMAANSTPSATSSGLSQALLDYNTALHGATFQRLRPPLGWRLAGAGRRLLGVAALAGAAGGVWLGGAALLRATGVEAGFAAPALASLEHVTRAYRRIVLRAGEVADETGSVAAGVRAAASEAKHPGAAAAAAASPAPPPPRPRRARRWALRWPGRQRREDQEWAERQRAEAEAARAGEAAEAEAEAMAGEEGPRRPWWRLDRVLRRARAPVAAAAAAVAAPAAVAADTVVGAARTTAAAAAKATDAVVTTVEDVALSAAGAAAGKTADVAQKAVQRRVAKALGAF